MYRSSGRDSAWKYYLICPSTRGTGLFQRSLPHSRIVFLGTGQSDQVDLWADLWWLKDVRQAKALIEYLGFKQAVLIGSSGGAVESLLAAIHFPKQVCVVVADSFVEKAAREQFRERVIAGRVQPSTKDSLLRWLHIKDKMELIGIYELPCSTREIRDLHRS